LRFSNLFLKEKKIKIEFHSSIHSHDIANKKKQKYKKN